MLNETSSYLSGANADYLENLYEQFLKDPRSVSSEWQKYFETFPSNGSSSTGVFHSDVREQFLQLAKQSSPSSKRTAASSENIQQLEKQFALEKLSLAYKTYGHLLAQINPLGNKLPYVPELDIVHYPALNSPADAESIANLKEIYCGSVGAEFMYITNAKERDWINQRLVERLTNVPSAEEKLNILKLLTAADGLEKYLAAKYVGQKRFSLEGGDSFIPLVSTLNECAVKNGVKEITVGMAHRGRLNMLINIFGKPAEELFAEFEGRRDFGMTSGDVKYHLGYSSDIDTPLGPLHLSLAFNPSHLEVISAVLMGSVRARQEFRDHSHEKEVMGVVVHGDASFAGQGIVMETLNMSQTRAYKIGGTIHLVINNQVGFTTSNIHDARSSHYCTDIAKMIEAPVFHVNGDDPEAVCYIAALAADYRAQFHKDIVIDLVCYRRLGHNEADEPSATQPEMYHFIRQHPTPREIYAERLIKEGVCTQADADTFVNNYRDLLDTGKSVLNAHKNGLTQRNAMNWKPYLGQEWTAQVDTRVSKTKLLELAQKLSALPQDFEVQRQVSHILENRTKMSQGEIHIDWGYAETLAYATLLDENYSIRMSGQDCRRGTFSHRHAVLHDQKNGKTYVPLHNLGKNQSTFQIYDSLLSEMGPVGFEYGYSSTDPKTLVLWEAQYGDFANGAQVVVDQFISSAWQKWSTLSGLTLLLPHGYEGAGPEHSSARLERYLQLCAQDNIQVCIPTTPAQIFHLLRRQLLRLYRSPLIVLTPKSMLRLKLASSTLNELSEGKFQLIIPEIDPIPPAKVTRVIFCSGKVYYDLLSNRREKKLTNTAILRIEQLYPFPQAETQALLKHYPKVKEVVWCQEEPQNQGAWLTMQHWISACLPKGLKLQYAGCPASASPAAGYMKLHEKQQSDLVREALG